ncbi:MAG: glycerate dehydrogenase [Rariglobus sp.]|jgi:phosphoglycerate dehydrogenase-like enzyme|nr:glycerate dehydrogenase [Rariglobus sp.]
MISLSPSVSTSPLPVRQPPRAVFAMDPDALNLVYGPHDRQAMAGLVDIGDLVLTPGNWRNHLDTLRETEFIFSGWKAPCFDADFLASTPNLRAIFYAAGSVRYCTSEAFWSRNIPITSAYAANAVPVAEYTVSVCILALKQFWRRSALARRGEGWGDHTRPIPGAFRATIGLVSFGMIARKVAELLRAYDVDVLVYCPYLKPSEAARLGVRLASIAEVFQNADVVSVHTPVLPETLGLVGGELVSLMKPDATLINTARGRILDQPTVIAALRARPDLTAVLDVTDPEPPSADDPLFTLPNVIVTPHIAGSHGRECQRMGSYMVDELRRFLAGQPLRWRVTHEMINRMA